MDSRAEILNSNRYAVPGSEAERLTALNEYHILDISVEAAMHELALRAAQVCEAGAAAIQVFAEQGRARTVASFNLAGHRICDHLCSLAIQDSPALFIATAKDMPYPGLFAALPLQNSQGLLLGLLCVLDHKPLALSPLQQDELMKLRNDFMVQLEQRRHPVENAAPLQQALQEVEQRLHLANEIAAIAVWEYDYEQDALSWKTPLKALHTDATQARECSLAAFLARVHEDDHQPFLDALRVTLEWPEEREFALDYRVRAPGAEHYLWLASRARRLRTPDGRTRLIGTAQEITDERNATLKLLRINALLEEQIRERKLAEQRQNALMELGDLLRGQPDSLTIATAVVQALAASLNVCRVAFLGIEPGSQYATVERYWHNGKLYDFSERMHLADYADLIDDLQNDMLVVVKDVQDDTRTLLVAARLHQQHIHSFVGVPLHEQGRLSAVLVLMEDMPRQWSEEDLSFIREITDRAWTADERIRAERALRASEEHFRTLADNMSQFAWMADPNGHIYWYNKRWYDYTGTTYEAMRALSWRTVNHPDHHERVTKSLKRAMATGSIWEETFPLRGKNGQYRWFLSRALPIRDEFGQVTRWFGTSTDITAQFKAEEALRELNEHLERRVSERTRELAEINHLLHVEMNERERAEETLRHAQKMEAIGQLTGGLAHDFNNMLSGVLGALELIQRRIASGRTDNLERYLEAATTSANRAAALTHRLLAFARRQPLALKPVDVNHLVLSMEDMLRRTLAEHITLETRLQHEPWMAYTDAHQLENALLNLVINARDAMSERGGRLIIQTGCVQINSVQHDQLEPGDYVTLSVADTGCGMPAQVVAKAFEPFFTTKPIGQGTGLGLSMVYGFTKQTGGQIRIDSSPGQGTLITLFLPRSHMLAREPDQPHGASPAPLRAQCDETILLVEDEIAVRMLVTEVLEELGYRVLTAQDANAAMVHLQSEARIDLLISDIGLAGTNGRQLAAKARQLRPGLRVLLVTGYAPELKAGDNTLTADMDLLAKPFSIDVLGTRVRQLLERGN